MLKLFIFYTIYLFYLINLFEVFASSHLIFNSKDGKYEEEDSLYLIRHPYLLNDFYNQIEWIKELLELKTTVRQQKILINKKYDYDDIEIEQKIRTTDDDCIRSRNFDPKKVFLLRCNKKIIKEMKNQHINLAIERVDQLDDFINSNRAPITARLQSKLAYEYFEYGESLPYFNCKEIIRNDGKKERKRLVCNVTDWEIYNELLNKQKEKKVEIIQQELLELNFINNERLNRKENDEKIEKKRNSELKEYKNKLKNFIKNIGKLMENGPQFIPKYPILNKPNKELFEFFHPSWPSIQKCNEFINEIIFEKENYLNNLRLPELFISPENKGFLISDLLTKYLLIGNNQLTPLPWKLPYCSPYINKTLLFDEKLNFIENLNIFKKLKSGYFEPSDKFAEKRLKNELFKLIGYNLNINKLNEQQLEQQQQPLIREIGQRIGNLIEFDIGPRWITFNLAALYFRYIGIPKEAIICLEEALKYSKYEDIALTQLAQIILRLNNSINDKNNGLEKIISLSMHLGLNEPIPFNLMAIFYQLKGNSFNSETMELDYNFKPSLNILLNKKCSQRIINSKQTSFLKFNNIYSSPICCWPNEQNIYCFKTINKNKKIIINCYKLEEYLFNNNNFNLIYFRCNNTPYKGKSYPIPGFVNLIIPFLFPIVKLREIKDNIFSKKLEEEFEQKLTKENKIIKEIPVFPLDYGGYSIERINDYQRPIWPEGVQEQINQFEINFNLNEEENKYLNKIKEEKQQINEKNNLINKKEQFINSLSFKQSNIFNNNNQINENLLKSFVNLKEVLYNFDISLPKKLPIPSIYMVNKGKEIFSFSLTSLKEICQKKLLNNLLFEQPISTWVSPSAKGININDYINFNELFNNNNYLNLLKEPKCPKIIKQNLIITELDKLPAYIYRKYLTKFYKPEKALREVFYSITNSSKLDNIEIVANKLFFAFKRSINSNSSNNNINYFIFGIISSLYWRIKGDPINSIKCLRYSLNNSPKEFIDIPLVSLANIYHQAGFLHSALYILENAFKTGENIVGVHFTLANVYSTIGDYPRALKFYYSTLSLQSNFKPAKDSITALHCLTNGKFLIKEEN